MAGYFEIKTRADGSYWFNLKASNHQVILISEAYASKSACLNGVTSVKKNCLDDLRYLRKTSKDGSAYFVLTGANGEVVGRSEMYSTASAMEIGIASVKANAPAAPAKDLA